MYQFISGIAFEITLIILFGYGYLNMTGIIKNKYSATEDFISWKNKNGQIIKWICLMVIILCIASIVAKSVQFNMGNNSDLIDTNN